MPPVCMRRAGMAQQWAASVGSLKAIAKGTAANVLGKHSALCWPAVGGSSWARCRALPVTVPPSSAALSTSSLAPASASANRRRSRASSSAVQNLPPWSAGEGNALRCRPQQRHLQPPRKFHPSHPP